jgi:3-hydroxyacyl-CoA dehydrogenase
MAAMEQADASAAVKAVLIVGEGKAFIAGADIREFGKPPVRLSCPMSATVSRPAASPWWP